MTKFGKELQNLFGAHDPGEIEELNLDDLWTNKDTFTEDEKSTLEKYTKLIHLSLNNIGFKSLKNFPCIKNLYMLSLNNNKLTGDDFDLINHLYPYLNKLKLNKNNIEKIENFSKITISTLNKIEVKENPFSIKNKEYKNELFKMNPNLKAIDHEDENGDNVESSDYYNEEEENEEDEDYEEDEEEEIKENIDDKNKNKRIKRDEKDNNENKENEEEEDDEDNEEEEED